MVVKAYKTYIDVRRSVDIAGQVSVYYWPPKYLIISWLANVLYLVESVVAVLTLGMVHAEFLGAWGWNVDRWANRVRFVGEEDSIVG